MKLLTSDKTILANLWNFDGGDYACSEFRALEKYIYGHPMDKLKASNDIA